MKYSIFNYIVESNIPLPELQENSSAPPTIFFNSLQDSPPDIAIKWIHHWKLPNGNTSISVGKEKESYWLRFPGISDFKLQPDNNHISSYSNTKIPNHTISHLLLDQVIPRLLSHNGDLIIHASCVQIDDNGVLFCGNSGWGKSTLAAFFYSEGHPLLTDDCILLRTKKSDMLGTPSYHGIRLLNDSLAQLPNLPETLTDVCHYSQKKRLSLPEEKRVQTLPISAIFMLRDPKLPPNDFTTTDNIPRSKAIIELIKHCFPLDITDRNKTSQQLTSLAGLIKKYKTRFLKLNSPRRMESLPDIMKAIITASTAPLHKN